MNYRYIAELSSLMSDVPEGTIVSRSIHKADDANVTLFGFAAGQELTEHTSTRAAILYFLEGQARLTLGDDQQRAQAGTFVYMPPQLPHSIFAEEETKMLLILV